MNCHCCCYCGSALLFPRHGAATIVTSHCYLLLYRLQLLSITFNMEVSRPCFCSWHCFRGRGSRDAMYGVPIWGGSIVLVPQLLLCLVSATHQSPARVPPVTDSRPAVLTVAGPCTRLRLLNSSPKRALVHFMQSFSFQCHWLTFVPSSRCRRQIKTCEIGSAVRLWSREAAAGFTPCLMGCGVAVVWAQPKALLTTHPQPPCQHL
jgi:hypothetical protein